VKLTARGAAPLTGLACRVTVGAAVPPELELPPEDDELLEELPVPPELLLEDEELELPPLEEELLELPATTPPVPIPLRLCPCAIVKENGRLTTPLEFLTQAWTV